MIKRALRVILAALLILCAFVPSGAAQDFSAAFRDIATGSDFRLRATAALALGKAKTAAARGALEKALADPHPSVRAAAAAALGANGDASSLGALRSAAAKETAPAVKAQMESTIKRLGAPAPSKARFLVAIGKMENKSGVTGPALTSLFKQSTRTQLAQIPGAEVLAEGSDISAQGKSRGLPVFALDGSLTRLTRGQSGSDVSYSAKVEYLIRQVPEQSLKGSVTGAAQALASSSALKGERELAQLQAEAVSAAVETAMKGAPPALEAATKSSKP